MVAFYACKEERNLPIQQQQDNYVQVTSSDGALVQKQLIWIAKGLAGIADQSAAVKSEIHTFVELTDFYIETNENLDADLQTSLSYDYDYEVDQWLQNNQPGNDYDASYFFDIDIDNCLGKVTVQIPEADTIDKTKLHVVTLDNPLDQLSTTPGYFISGAGLIDSIIITEDNMDSVYLWIVGVAQNCPEDTFNSETAMRLPPLSPPQGPSYTVRIGNLNINTDKKNVSSNHPEDIYQEGHLRGKYEIRAASGIYDARDFSEWREVNFQDYGGYHVVGNYKAWGRHGKKGRKVIKRYNGSSGKSNRGGHWTEPVNKVISDEYYPDLENFVFVLFEKDEVGPAGRPDNSCYSRNWGYTYSPGQSNQYTITPASSSGGPLLNGQLSDNWVVIESDTSPTGPGGQQLPSGVWIPTGATTYETVLSLDGEMSVVLTLTQN
jgi:hypothetical protein